MSRNSLGVALDEVFAEVGDRVEFPAFTTGWDSDYSTPSSGKFPERTAFNDLFAKLTACCDDLNKYGGALPWDTNIVYEQYALVTSAVDGGIYIATVSNTGKEPSANPTEWTDTDAVLALKVDLDGGNIDASAKASLNTALGLDYTIELAGSAYVGGDKTGGSRGMGAIDIQADGGGSGLIASGLQSVTYGRDNSATTQGCSAVGNTNVASAVHASAFGMENTASGYASSASGYDNAAEGYRSSAHGQGNTASGYASSASGYYNSASGQNATAMGYGNTASGVYNPTAMGYSNTASGYYDAVAIGFSNTASGSYSIAIGSSNSSSGYNSVAVGISCEVSQTDAVAMGRGCAATASAAVSIGERARTTVSNTLEVGNWLNSTVRTTGIRMHNDGQIASTIRNNASAPTDGGATAGSEALGTLPRSTFSIQRNGNAVTLYFNDAGTIKSLSLGSLA